MEVASPLRALLVAEPPNLAALRAVSPDVDRADVPADGPAGTFAQNCLHALLVGRLVLLPAYMLYAEDFELADERVDLLLELGKLRLLDPVLAVYLSHKELAVAVNDEVVHLIVPDDLLQTEN